MFIAKHRQKNSFRVIENIRDFSVEDFHTYHLYESRELTPEAYTEILKNEEIANLTKRLKDLGIDLNAIQQPQAPVQAQAPVAPAGAITGVAPVAQSDTPQNTPPVDPNVRVPLREQVSKVKKLDGTFYNMDEIRLNSEKFKEYAERSIPELSFVTYNETGIQLQILEIRNDIPRNIEGIPIVQTV